MIRKFSTALRITADKREIKDFYKLLLATSFIRKCCVQYLGQD